MLPELEGSTELAAWRPFDMPKEKVDFAMSLKTLTGSGDPTVREGLAVHQYACTKSMDKQAFVSLDGVSMGVASSARTDDLFAVGHYDSPRGRTIGRANRIWKAHGPPWRDISGSAWHSLQSEQPQWIRGTGN